MADIIFYPKEGAEYVKVVRCKDCRHYRTNNTMGYPHCEILKRFATEDWFCAYGVRKDATD